MKNTTTNEMETIVFKNFRRQGDMTAIEIKSKAGDIFN